MEVAEQASARSILACFWLARVPHVASEHSLRTAWHDESILKLFSKSLCVFLV